MLQGHVPGKGRNGNVTVGTPRLQQVEGGRNRRAITLHSLDQEFLLREKKIQKVEQLG
jgi:hypothetical protein